MAARGGIRPAFGGPGSSAPGPPPLEAARVRRPAVFLGVMGVWVGFDDDAEGAQRRLAQIVSASMRGRGTSPLL